VPGNTFFFFLYWRVYAIINKNNFEGVFSKVHPMLDEIGLTHIGTFLPEKDELLEYVNLRAPTRTEPTLPEVSNQMNTWVGRRFSSFKEEYWAVIKACSVWCVR